MNPNCVPTDVIVSLFSSVADRAMLSDVPIPRCAEKWPSAADSTAGKSPINASSARELRRCIGLLSVTAIAPVTVVASDQAASALVEHERDRLALIDVVERLENRPSRRLAGAHDEHHLAN